MQRAETGHQGFSTLEALTAIAETTVASPDAFERTGRSVDEVPFVDRAAYKIAAPSKVPA
jgi:hypothetical protein